VLKIAVKNRSKEQQNFIEIKHFKNNNKYLIYYNIFLKPNSNLENKKFSAKNSSKE